MAAPNIVNVSTIIGKTAVANATTTPTDLVTNAADSGKVFKVNSIYVANIDGTNLADITVAIRRSSVDYGLASTVSVPADSTLVVLSKEASIYLEEGDSIRVTASADGDLQVIVSYEEIS